MNCTLSITIVAYHNYKDIKKAVQTIEKYTSKKIIKKIYIVDNSCFPKKNILEINNFKKFINKYDDIKFIKTESNLGFGKAHNYVLNELNSKYHAIVNPDILFKEDAFKTIITYMDSHSEVGMCIPNMVDENGERQLVYRKEPTISDMFIRRFCKSFFTKRQAKHTLQNQDYSKPFQVPFGQGSFLVIETQLMKSLNGFDENYFMYLEDADLCKRVNNISKLMYFPDATVIHKWKKGSHNNIKLFFYHLKSARYYFKKWGYKFF